MSARQEWKSSGARRQEWEAFLALTPVMEVGDTQTSTYKRLYGACSRLAAKGVVTRDVLILEAGLSFFEECAEPDLALMGLVRRGILKPIPQEPFQFAIQSGTASNNDFTKTEELPMQQAKRSEPPRPVTAGPIPAEHGKEIAVPELPPEIAEQLKKPLPQEAVSAHPTLAGLSSVKVIYVVERLNEVFGLNGWEDDYEIVETGPMVVVHGCLRIPKYGIVRQQYGGNDNPDRGDAYKGACTDALSKCASQLGIAMDVYKGLQPAGPVPQPKPPHEPPSIEPNTAAIDLRRESADDRARRFRQMEEVLGSDAYLDMLARHGYSREPDTIDLATARTIYRDLLVVLRGRFERARQAVTEQQYRQLLRSLRLNPKAKLNADQLVRLFEALSEEIHAQQ
jgi:hypothetical protein